MPRTTLKRITWAIFPIILWTFGGGPAFAALAVSEQAREARRDAARQSLPRGFDDVVADLGVALEDVARGESDALDQAIALGTEIQKRDAALRKEFADVEAIIRAKGLPDEILQRHREIVTEYERRLAALAEGLRNVEQGTKLPDGGVRRAWARTKLFFDGDPAREDAAADTLELIESYKPKRVQKSFTAEDLPFKRLVPISTPEIFGADAAWNPNPENGRAWLPSMQELASRTVDLLLAPASAQSSGTPDPEDLAETVEVAFTPDVQALAEQLGNDPVEIYNWVRNNIYFVPVWGSVQGSEQCLQVRQCSAHDTASLLISLLRVAGIPARYRIGTISVAADKYANWVGGFSRPEDAASFAASVGTPQVVRRVDSEGNTVAIRQSHIWVEAFVDFYPSQGAQNVNADRWVDLDASYKQYDYTAARDLSANVSQNSQNLAGAVRQQIETSGAIDIVNLEALAQSIQSDMQDAYNAGVFAGDTNDVFGGAVFHRVLSEVFSPVLPYEVLGQSNSFSAVPTDQRHTLEVRLQRGSEPILSWSAPTARVAASPLTLSYKGATDADREAIRAFAAGGLPRAVIPSSIRVVPELVLDGTVIETASGAVPFGESLSVEMRLAAPTVARPLLVNSQLAGEVLVITLNSGGVSQASIDRNRDQAAELAASATGGTNPSVAEDRALEIMLHRLGLDWFSSVDHFDSLVAGARGAKTIRFPSLGSSFLDLNQRQFLGVPLGASIAGIGIDVDADVVATHAASDPNADIVAISLTQGIIGSLLEAAVPNELFGRLPERPQWESTVTVLRSAAQQGGEIVAINSANLISTLPNLTLPAEVLEDIRSAVAGGLLAITTAAPVTDIEYPDFSGVGYILLDKETGSSAFLVSGGTNGAIQKLRYEVQSCGPLVASTNIMIAQASDCPGGEDWLDKLASTLSSVAGGAIDTLSGIKGILDTLSDCLRSIAAPQNAQQAIFSVSVIVTWLILAALLLFSSLAGPVAFVVGLALTASLEFALDCET